MSSDRFWETEVVPSIHTPPVFLVMFNITCHKFKFEFLQNVLISFMMAFRIDEKRNAYWILVGKPEGKRPLGTPRSWWVGNFKMDLRGLGWSGMDSIDLAHDRDRWRALVNTALNHRVP
jgi:hypothetical protein